MDVSVIIFVESNGVLSIVGTAKPSGACVTNSSAFRRTLYNHALSYTSVADLVLIGSANFNDNFSSPLYINYFHCDKESKILLTNGNIQPSECYAWDTYAMILQSSVHSSGKELIPYDDVKTEGI